MNIVSMIAKSNQRCGICLGDFEVGEPAVTHEDALHDPFHRACFRRWIQIKPDCPYDRVFIKPNSIISRTEEVALETLSFPPGTPAFVVYILKYFLTLLEDE